MTAPHHSVEWELVVLTVLLEADLRLICLFQVASGDSPHTFHVRCQSVALSLQAEISIIDKAVACWIDHSKGDAWEQASSRHLLIENWDVCDCLLLHRLILRIVVKVDLFGILKYLFSNWLILPRQHLINSQVSAVQDG